MGVFRRPWAWQLEKNQFLLISNLVLFSYIFLFSYVLYRFTPYPGTGLLMRKSTLPDFELGKMSLKRFLNFRSKIDRPKVGVAGKALQIRNPQAIAVDIDTGYQS